MLDHLFSNWWYGLTIAQNKYPLLFADSDPKFEEIVDDWDALSYLIMTKDTIRMEAYRQAIQQYAKGKVVLEIGTGALTPLARMCVQAGAKKVYAIEGNHQAAEIARKGLQRDGLQDKIEIIEGFSTEIDALPEKADLLVHELIGVIASDEGMAPIVADAKQKFLKPNALIIPALSQVYITPVNCQNLDGLSRKLFQLWGNLVSRMVKRNHLYTKSSDQYLVYNFPDSNLIDEPCEYENINFLQNFSLEERREIKFTINKKQLFNGFLLWNQITTAPDRVINCLQGTHWPALLLSFSQEPVQLYQGDVLILDTYKNLINPTPQYKFNFQIVRNNQPLELEKKYIAINC